MPVSVRLSTSVVLALLVAAVAGSAAAQAPAFDRAIRASAALELTAQRVTAPEPVTLAPALARSMAVKSSKSQKSMGETLMIVGGGAVLAGALIGGDGGTLLIVGGFGCAGYGYYLYQK